MVCLFRTDEIHLFDFLFCFIVRLKVVFDIFEQLCGPRSFTFVAYLSSMVWFKQYCCVFCQECKIHLDRFIFRMELWISSDCNLSFPCTDLSFYLCQIIFQRLLVYKFEEEFQLPHRISGDISMHYSDSLPYILHTLS
jgi:hypothetical protein